VADRIQDPQRREELLRQADELEKLIPQILGATKGVLANPEDRQARAHLDDLVRRGIEANAALARAVLEDQLALNNQQLKRNLAALDAAVRAGDDPTAVEALKGVNDAVQRRVELGHHLADLVDPSTRRNILDATETMQSILPQLGIATKDALTSREQPAIEKVSALIKDLSDAADRVTGRRIPTNVDELINGIINTGGTVNSLIEQLQAAVREGRVKDALALVGALIQQLQNQVDFGRELAKSIDDPVLKKKLLDACDTLERIIPQLLPATQDALNHPNDPAAQRRLADLLSEAKKANDTITDIAQQIKRMRNKPREPRPPPQQYDIPNDGSRDEVTLAARSITLAIKKEIRVVSPE